MSRDITEVIDDYCMARYGHTNWAWTDTLNEEEQKRMKKAKELKEVLDDFMAKKKDLKEFEEELKKNKDMLTPGQVGES